MVFVEFALQLETQDYVDVFWRHHECFTGGDENVLLIVEFKEVETQVAIAHGEEGVFCLAPGRRLRRLNLKHNFVFARIGKWPRPDVPTKILIAR